MWNYRVIHFKGDDNSSHSNYYSIHEVYYDQYGNPIGYAGNPAHISWDEDEENGGKEDLRLMAQAFDRPILEIDSFINK